RHLPAGDVVAGDLRDVGVGGERVEAAGRHVYHRTARQQATDAEAVTGGNGGNLVGGAGENDDGRGAVSGIEMFLKVRGEVRAAALRIGTGDADQQKGN